MDKILAGSAKHLELVGGLKDLEYLMLNLQFRCNYSCLGCCNSNREISKKGTPLSLEKISSLIDEAKDLGMRVVVIAGEGEPFLDKRIDTIIGEIYYAGLIPYIFTNGSLLNKERAQFLKEHNASLVIQLNSLNKDTYEKLSCKAGSFDIVIDNLENIRNVFSDTYSTIGNYGLRRIAINAVISSVNLDELFVKGFNIDGKFIKCFICGEEPDIFEPLKDFCGNDFALVYNSLMRIGKASSDENFEDIEEIKVRIRESSKNSFPLGTISSGQWCAYMRNGISVGAGGDILTCAYSLESAGKLGNIREGVLRKYFGIANSAVDKFYEQNVHNRCILRHLYYKEFIHGL